MLRLPTTPLSPTKLYADYFQRPRRRVYVIRILALSLSVILCYVVATHVSEPTWVPSVVHEQLGFGSSRTPTEKLHGTRPTDDETTELEALTSIDVEADTAYDAEGTTSELELGDSAYSVAYEESEESISHADSRPFVAHNIGNGDVYSFKEALGDVLSNVPDEIHTRDLLRPIEGGGQERLKEVGIRTRAFAKFFNLWEALHVVADDKITYVRDDIIQYLENAPEEDLVQMSLMERGDMIRAYEKYRFFLSRLSGLLFPWTAPYFSDHMTLHAHFHHGGRGIVLSGNDKQAPYFLTSIESFRRLGCNLPVEIMYLGEEDLGDDWRMKLEALPGVTTRDLSQMVSDDGWELKGWASKAFALLMSSFREVIYLDADALFFVNPEELFEDPGYTETGALFFRDRVFAPQSRKQWLRDILPKPISKKAQTSRYWTGESREQQESGALVVDKWRHFVAMLAVTRMNGPDRDDNPKTGAKGVYSLFYGDKETFWLGWELAGDTDYWFHEGDAGNMGVISEQIEYTLTDGHIVPLEKDEHDNENAPEGEDADNDAPEEEDAGDDASGDGNAGNVSDDSKPKKPTKKNKNTHTLYTVSSPQLLHLDLKGRPLWFNGWILDDKYEEKQHVNVSKMEVYMSERKDTGEAPEWRIGGHNMATLKSTKASKFTQKEKNVWNMFVKIAKQNGAIGKNQ